MEGGCSTGCELTKPCLTRPARLSRQRTCGKARSSWRPRNSPRFCRTAIMRSCSGVSASSVGGGGTKRTRMSTCWLSPGGSIRPRHSESEARLSSAMLAASSICMGVTTGIGSIKPITSRISGTAGSLISLTTIP